MASCDLFRSAAVHTDGRTLSGVAMPFGRIALVSDAGGPAYREGFHRAAFTKSLRERGAKPYPLAMMHPYEQGARTSPVPLGPASFRATPTALEFEARVSRTRDGDEALELLQDGILGDVSIGFRAFRSRPAKDAQGPWIERMEAMPLELSLAIVGTGQYPGAQVMAIRSTASEAGPDTTSTPHLDELRRQRALLILP